MKMEKEKIRYILQFFFDKPDNISHTTKIVNGVNGSDTVGIFDVKDALCTGMSVIENVDIFGDMIEVDRHVSSRKIDHKTVLNQ